MLAKETILSRLHEEVSGTEQEFYTAQELDEFASFYVPHWDGNTSHYVIAESFVDFWWDKPNACRRCTECGKLMVSGYCVDQGDEYYCSDDCRHNKWTDEQWSEECDTNPQSYYTEWR